MSSIVLNDSTHADCGSAFEQSSCHNGVGPRDSIAATSNGQDAIVNALHDFADAGLDASLLAQIGDVLSALSDDDTGLLGWDERAQSQLRLGVLFVRLGCRLAIGAKARLIVIDVHMTNGISEFSPIVGRMGVLRRRHDYKKGLRRWEGEGASIIRWS